MAHLITPGEALQALGAFLGYLDDLADAGLEAASTKLRLVINASQRDAALRALSEQLLTRMPREELDRCLAGDAFAPPPDPLGRMAFAYALLRQLKLGERLDLRALLAREAFRGAGGLEARWELLRAALLAPLRSGLTHLVRHLQGLPPAESLDLERVYEQALAGLALTEPEAAPSAPPQPGAGASPLGGGESPDGAGEPGGALGQLRARIRALIPAPALQQDLLLDARILGVELEKLSPDPERLAELLRELVAADEQLLAPALASLLESREGDLAGARRAFQDAPTRRMGEKPRPAPRTTRRVAPREGTTHDAPTRRRTARAKKKK